MRGQGRGVEVAGFDNAMAEQKKRGKESWAGSGDNKQSPIWFQLKEQHGETNFLGYETLESEGRVIALVNDNGLSVGSLINQGGWVVLDQTPFYGESGGQMGDRGTLGSNRVIEQRPRVEGTIKYQGIIAHYIRMAGKINIGDDVLAKVDDRWRDGVRANHSATHLLHEALRQELGHHVAQKGSLVANDHLRFDFSHHEAIDKNRLEKIEAAVNERIAMGGTVKTKIMDKPSAEAMGAIALFGEKYGDKVRVVFMGAGNDKTASNERKNFYSIELCGGTHVADVANIEWLMIEHEESVASGVRRITARAGNTNINNSLEGMIAAWQAKIKTINDSYVPMTNIPNDIAAKRNIIEKLHQDYDEALREDKKRAKEAADKKLRRRCLRLMWPTLNNTPARGLLFLPKKLTG